MERPIVFLLNTGKLNYAKGLILQKYLCKKFYNNRLCDAKTFRNILILTEHYPTYTIGIRRKEYTKNDEERLRKLGAEFYKTNRGGLITFHGPGQLVAYPIIHLKQFNLNMRCYVHQLEITIIDLCKKFNIEANTSKDTGIWVNNNKICAIGIHGSRYITTHGIGLNCNTDLNWFEHIIPCGIKDKGVTSITKELGYNVAIDDVIPKFIDSFQNKFKCNIENLLSNDKEIIMEYVNDERNLEQLQVYL